jgi:hypothetical protein
MSSVHLKLDSLEIKDLKRNMLRAERDILESVIQEKKYSVLVKKKTIFLSQLRKRVRMAEKIISEIYNLLPQDLETSMDVKLERKIRREHKEEEGHKDIEKQLKEIQEKLALLDKY